jgi:outer membrane protein TolC
MRATIPLATALLFMALPLNGADKENGTATKVTLDECIASAVKNNNRLKIASSRIDAANARWSESSDAMLPQVKFTGRAAVLSPVDEMSISLPILPQPITLFPAINHSYSARVAVQQPLFLGFRLSSNKEMNGYGVEASKMEFARDEEDLRMDVTTAYWRLYQTIQIERTIASSLDLVVQLAADIRALLKGGMATEVDVLKIDTRLSDMKTKHIEAKSNIRLAQMLLNTLIGRPLSSMIVPAESSEDSKELLQENSSRDLDSLVNNAFTLRSELRLLEFRSKMAEQGVAIAKSSWYPQVYLSAGYDMANPNQRIIPPKDEFKGTWDIGVSVQWTMWDWNTTGHQMAQAEANKVQLDASIAQSKDAVALEVAQSFYRMQDSRERIDVGEQGIKQAEETFRMINEKFKQGMATNTDVLDAQSALLQARLTHTNAVVDFVLAKARLQKATGTYSQGKYN